MAVHRYLRAVGFSNIEKREQLKELIGEVVTKTVLQETRPEMEQNIKETGRYATKNFVADQEDHLYAELCLDFAKDAGICVRGEVDKKNVFLYEYYFTLHIYSSNFSFGLNHPNGLIGKLLYSLIQYFALFFKSSKL